MVSTVTSSLVSRTCNLGNFTKIIAEMCKRMIFFFSAEIAGYDAELQLLYSTESRIETYLPEGSASNDYVINLKARVYDTLKSFVLYDIANVTVRALKIFSFLAQYNCSCFHPSWLVTFCRVLQDRPKASRARSTRFWKCLLRTTTCRGWTLQEISR